jgi:hypothetical protein
MNWNLAHISNDPFLGTDCVAILQLMLGKVDCGDGALVLDLVDRPLDMSFGAGHDRGEMKGSKGKMAGREAQRGDARERCSDTLYPPLRSYSCYTSVTT